MTQNPRTALLVGCGQVKQKLEDPSLAHEPIQLMESAARLAAEDAKAPSLLQAVDAIWVLRGIWDYSNPAALLADRLGASRVDTGLAPISGSSVQRLICTAIAEIEAGRHDVVLITGGEAEYSKRRIVRSGGQPARTPQTNSSPKRNFGGDPQMVTPEEVALGLAMPASVYSMYENALRHESGRSLADHRAYVSKLCARMSTVAAANPYGWDDAALTPDQIGNDIDGNRMVSYPYTKRMVANMVVDQAAAVLVCSSEAAAKYGVAMDRVVYPNVVVEVSKMPMLSNRENYKGVTALGVAGKRALEMAELSIEDISLIDIYSCFPAAVQVGMRELGLGDDATPTLTGGLNHGGGPFNSYVMHSIATAMNKVRDARGEPALVTSLGGWFSKMAFGVYSAEPPRNGYAYTCLDDEISKLPSRALSQNVNANSTIETYALSYFQQKPHQAVIACLLDDGSRLFATTNDDDTLEELLRIEPCGRDVAVTTEGKFELR